jgi:hypothetical protein
MAPIHGTIEYGEAALEEAPVCGKGHAAHLPAEWTAIFNTDAEEMLPECEEQIIQTRARIVGGQEQLTDFERLDD